MQMQNKFTELEACYGQLASWCNLLEAIADFLPCHVDERLCDTVTGGLIPLLQATHGLEEHVVSASLHAIMPDHDRVEAENRRSTERLFDMDAAQEVVDVLLALKNGDCRLSWDAIAYLRQNAMAAVRPSGWEEEGQPSSAISITHPILFRNDLRSQRGRECG